MTKEEQFVNELIGYIFAYPDDDYMTMECLCRKLVKHRLLDKADGYYQTHEIRTNTHECVKDTHDKTENSSEKPNNCEDDAMSPKEFAEKMQTIAEVRDPEERHSKMDDLMCDLLRSLGYGEGVEMFKDVEKWYS